MTFDADAALTTPAGRTLDPRFFFDSTDRNARALISDVEKNITLYNGNPFYTENRPNLWLHNMGLIDNFLAHPHIAIKIQKNDPYALDVVPMLLSSDNGEAKFEVLSYAQKSNPRLPFFDVKPYETHTAIYTYHIAQCYAIRGMQDVFIKNMTALQNEFSYFYAEVVACEPYPAQYKKLLEKTTALSMEKTENLCKIAARGLSHAQQATIKNNDAKYYQQYTTCEKPDLRRNSIAALTAKTIDKNCGLYTAHDRAKDPHGPEILLEREGSVRWRKTMMRSYEFLPDLFNLTRDDANKAFFVAASDIAFNRMIDYTARQQPVLALHDAAAAGEPPYTAAPSVFAEFCAQQKEMMQKRREKICWYPLEDTEYMTREEMIAKLMTEHDRFDAPDPYLFSNRGDYGKKRGYRKQFDTNLLNLKLGTQQLPLFE